MFFRKYRVVRPTCLARVATWPVDSKNFAKSFLKNSKEKFKKQKIKVVVKIFFFFLGTPTKKTTQILDCVDLSTLVFHTIHNKIFGYCCYKFCLKILKNEFYSSLYVLSLEYWKPFRWFRWTRYKSYIFGDESIRRYTDNYVRDIREYFISTNVVSINGGKYGFRNLRVRYDYEVRKIVRFHRKYGCQVKIFKYQLVSMYSKFH